MTMSRGVRAFVFVAALPIFAQQGAIPHSDRRITLDVVVTDKAGKAQSGLQQNDFTLVDNKLPQKIVSFQAIPGGATPAPPVEIILVVDRVNSSFAGTANERQQTEKFLRQNGGQLQWPTSIAFVSDSGTTMQSATKDGNALVTALEQSDNALRTTSRRSQGFYGAGDQLDLSLKALNGVVDYATKIPGRKLLVWLSPGWPLLSGPRVELSSKNQQGIFRTIVAISTGLRAAGITLYSIDPSGLADAAGSRVTYYQEFLKGVSKPSQVQAADLALQVLAVQSGGRALNSSNDMVSQIESCIADTNAWYTLSFDSPPADGPDEYHKLEVKVDKSGLTARTSTGYYAQP
jgi:VWFA-related protein